MLIANMMVYNDFPYLDVCICQLLEMVDSVLLMDNGSHDGSREYLSDVWGNNPRATVVLSQQKDPPDYGAMRNIMLRLTRDGDTVLKWDPDELPSTEMKAHLREYVNTPEQGWTIPIYHMIHNPRTALGFEAGFSHLRLFKKQSGTVFKGAVHEQVQLDGPVGAIPIESGIAVVHLSYYTKQRLLKKSQRYARIPNSGFSRPDELYNRLSWGTVPIPENVKVDVSQEYLYHLQETM